MVYIVCSDIHACQGLDTPAAHRLHTDLERLLRSTALHDTIMSCSISAKNTFSCRSLALPARNVRRVPARDVAVCVVAKPKGVTEPPRDPSRPPGVVLLFRYSFCVSIKLKYAMRGPTSWPPSFLCPATCKCILSGSSEQMNKSFSIVYMESLADELAFAESGLSTASERSSSCCSCVRIRGQC